MRATDVPLPTLRRLPIYCRYLREAAETGRRTLSSQQLGEACQMPPTRIRKDLSYLDEYGQAGVGYHVRSLLSCLQGYLGLREAKRAVIVGAGRLGRALASHPGFSRCGWRIVGLYDSDPAKIGARTANLTILPVTALADAIAGSHIDMAILTVPADQAQPVADLICGRGIRIIWNFAPIMLRVAPDVIVRNHDLAVELATLSHLAACQRASLGQAVGEMP